MESISLLGTVDCTHRRIDVTCARESQKHFYHTFSHRSGGHRGPLDTKVLFTSRASDCIRYVWKRNMANIPIWQENSFIWKEISINFIVWLAYENVPRGSTRHFQKLLSFVAFYPVSSLISDSLASDTLYVALRRWKVITGPKGTSVRSWFRWPRLEYTIRGQ